MLEEVERRKHLAEASPTITDRVSVSLLQSVHNSQGEEENRKPSSNVIPRHRQTDSGGGRPACPYWQLLQAEDSVSSAAAALSGLTTRTKGVANGTES